MKHGYFLPCLHRPHALHLWLMEPSDSPVFHYLCCQIASKGASDIPIITCSWLVCSLRLLLHREHPYMWIHLQTQIQSTLYLSHIPISSLVNHQSCSPKILIQVFVSSARYCKDALLKMFPSESSSKPRIMTFCAEMCDQITTTVLSRISLYLIKSHLPISKIYDPEIALHNFLLICSPTPLFITQVMMSANCQNVQMDCLDRFCYLQYSMWLHLSSFTLQHQYSVKSRNAEVPRHFLS